VKRIAIDQKIKARAHGNSNMIRTINEHHRSARRLFDLAKKAPMERRERLLRLARMNLRLAVAQLREPSLRPDTRLRMSADQYRAIAEFLLGNKEKEKRGAWFAAMAETAERCYWPSSAIAPFRVLTEEEASEIRNGPHELSQRVFAPSEHSA
jgi:hypothetical protein